MVTSAENSAANIEACLIISFCLDIFFEGQSSIYMIKLMRSL